MVCRRSVLKLITPLGIIIYGSIALIYLFCYLIGHEIVEKAYYMKLSEKAAFGSIAIFILADMWILGEMGVL